jgi:hypothetical protein
LERSSHPDRGPYALGGRLGRLAGASLRLREAVRVPGPLAGDQHVLVGRADILPDAVTSAERVDRVAEIEHRRPPPLGGELAVRRQRDHALAAAQGKPSQRALQRHRLGQPERILERLAPIPVAPKAAAPDRLAENRRVHGDDHEQRRALAERDRDSFVLEHLNILWIGLTLGLRYRDERSL